MPDVDDDVRAFYRRNAPRTTAWTRHAGQQADRLVPPRRWKRREGVDRHSFADRNTNRTVGTMLGREISRNGTARTGLPEDTIHAQVPRHRRARASAPLLAARGDPATWRARPTTTCRQGPVRRHVWSSTRSMKARSFTGGRTSSSATRCCTAPFPANATSSRRGRRAVRGAQLGRHRGGRGHRRSRLRIHDRRPWSSCSARRGATSPPGCPAASPTSSIRRADFERRCNPAMVELEPIMDEARALSTWTTRATTWRPRPGRRHGRHARHDALRLKQLVEKHLHYTGSETLPRPRFSTTGTTICRSSAR